MNEFPVVLVINCGSSSIKFSVLDASDCEVLMSGIADGINSENAFLSVNGGEPAPLAHHSYEGALKAIAFELEKRDLSPISSPCGSSRSRLRRQGHLCGISPRM